MPVLMLELPLPPSINHMYVRHRNGVALSEEARLYYEDMRWLMIGLPVPRRDIDG